MQQNQQQAVSISCSFPCLEVTFTAVNNKVVDRCVIDGVNIVRGYANLTCSRCIFAVIFTRSRATDYSPIGRSRIVYNNWEIVYVRSYVPMITRSKWLMAAKRSPLLSVNTSALWATILLRAISFFCTNWFGKIRIKNSCRRGRRIPLLQLQLTRIINKVQGY